MYAFFERPDAVYVPYSHLVSTTARGRLGDALTLVDRPFCWLVEASAFLKCYSPLLLTQPESAQLPDDCWDQISSQDIYLADKHAQVSKVCHAECNLSLMQLNNTIVGGVCTSYRKHGLFSFNGKPYMLLPGSWTGYAGKDIELCAFAAASWMRRMT